MASDSTNPRLEVYNDQPPWTPPPVNPTDPMGFWSSTQQEVHTMPKTTWQPLATTASDASYFLDCLDAGRDSEINAAEAAKTTEILLAGYKSAATGEVINLPLPRG
jgi:predicted dehydrogenase